MLLSYLRARLGREEGQALVEYALIVALIAVVALAVITLAGENVSAIFSNIANALDQPG
jgi:pilus assembly protein Flp/PilA